MSEPVRFLVGARIYLRPVEESDLDQAQRWINDPEIWHYLGVTRPLDRKAEQGWWEAHDRRPQPSSMHFGIVLAQNDELIGTTGFVRIDWLNRVAETGTLIGTKDRWGQGYGTESKELLLAYGFDTLDLHRIESRVIAYNARSAGHLLRTGFVDEGRDRQAVFRDGRRWDVLRYGLLAEEWRARRASGESPPAREG